MEVVVPWWMVTPWAAAGSPACLGGLGAGGLLPPAGDQGAELAQHQPAGGAGGGGAGGAGLHQQAGQDDGRLGEVRRHAGLGGGDGHHLARLVDGDGGDGVGEGVEGLGHHGVGVEGAGAPAEWAEELMVYGAGGGEPLRLPPELLLRQGLDDGGKVEGLHVGAGLRAHRHGLAPAGHGAEEREAERRRGAGRGELLAVEVGRHPQARQHGRVAEHHHRAAIRRARHPQLDASLKEVKQYWRLQLTSTI